MADYIDAVFLARLQFAFTVTFHFIFPSLTIGLASYLAVLEGLWLRTKNDVYIDLFHYWIKIFALVFSMGVVSGIVMSYQFGTNWAAFSVRAGPVIGPLMAYEVLTAFFLEAGFLGVMLFGMKRVGKGLHFFATLMVALGTLGSAFWILSVNSWMHTPTGFVMSPDGRFLPGDSWAAIIFNPSFPFRLTHTVIAAYLTTTLVVAAVGAWHLLRDRTHVGARKMFSMAMWVLAILGPIQIFAGDAHGLNTLEHQPVKIMAMEGHFKSYDKGAPLILFGIPDQDAQTMKYSIEVPKLSSLILRHDPNAPLAGLDQVPRDLQPPVGLVFWAFRIMVGIGFLILGLGLWSLFARWRGRLYDTPLLHRAVVAAGPLGFVAVIAGWVTTEVGRQPYTIYGHLLTSQSHSGIDLPAVTASLLAFVIVYTGVFGVGIWYALRLMSHAPTSQGISGQDRADVRAAAILAVGEGDVK